MPTIITRAAGSLKAMGFAGSSASSAAFSLAKSLRFRSSASTYLNRTLSSATNNKIWTWSAWVKRSKADDTFETLFSSGTSGSIIGWISFQGYAFWYTEYTPTLGYVLRNATAALFRDTSAWYHLMVVVDTTQGNGADRVKLYVNGVIPPLDPSPGLIIYPPQNYSTLINGSAYPHSIGRRQDNAAQYFTGCMTEVNFIDGQALTPSSFGTTNATTGQWSPAAYSGTYGTNGFHLPFTNTTSTTTLGYDTSSNGNNFTLNNFSLTAGSTYDSMTDVPVAYSATSSNYAVLNPIGIIPTLSDGNLSYTSATAAPAPAYSTIGMTTGKWYAELTTTTANFVFGVWGNGNASMPNSYPLYYWDFGWNTTGTLHTEKTSGTISGSGGTSAVGDVYAVAVDVDNTTVYFYQNNTLIYTITGMTFIGPLFFTVASWTGSASSQSSINFGQQGFKYTPPSGYLALNTYNLPSPAIAKGSSYMDTTLFAGAGANQSVINAGAFKPDVVWIKNITNSSNHQLADSVRGASYGIFPNLADGEGTSSNMISSFDNNGFSIAGSSNNLNASGSNYAAWQWQAGKGTNVTNTAGSVNSIVSVNTTAGFSIVSYTGPGGSNGTIGHGLGSTPAVIWTKVRSGINADWAVYHSAVGNTSALFLDTTAGSTSGTGYWNNTSPTANVFSVGNSSNTNYSATIPYIAYCWAPVAGYSAFGSYIGQGSSGSPFIYTGFRPAFIMIKDITSSSHWMMYDNKRPGYNNNYYLLVDTMFGGDGTDSPFQIYSNGFSPLAASGGIINYPSGDTFIYMAFAETPFKYSNAR